MGKSFLKKGKGLNLSNPFVGKKSKKIEVIEITRNNPGKDNECHDFSIANGWGCY